MSKINTNTNNGPNLNLNSGRGGRGQGNSTGRGCGDRRDGRGNTNIAKYAFEGKMKDGQISKLLITTGHRPTQFKEITDTLPVLWADKNFQDLNEVLQTGTNLDERDFMPPFLYANQWSTTHHVQVSTVNPLNSPLVDGLRPARFEMMEQTHVFDTNLQKEQLSLSEYKRDSKTSLRSTPSSLPTRRL